MADDTNKDDCAQRKDNVVQFPREITVGEKIRRCQRMIEKCASDIENADPDTLDGKMMFFMAERLLANWQEDLRNAEAKRAMLNADDAIHFGNKVYRAKCSPAGAN